MKSKRNKIGVFGGTFDPIHLGHLLLAEQAREQLRLDRVLFVPALIPPHKQAKRISSPAMRVQMLRLAGCEAPPFEISTIELDREGVSYTVDTLRRLSANHPSCDLTLIVGKDNLRDLHQWREPAALARLASVAYADRIEAATAGAAGNVEGVESGSATFRIERVAMPIIEISGRDIRERIAAGRSIRFLVPDPVAEFIQQHNLYRDATESEIAS